MKTMPTIVGASLAALISCAAFGQQAAAPAFEVASVKVHPPSTDGRVFRGIGSDPGMVSYTNFPLKSLLARAYNLKEYQVQGPVWIDTEGYDIVAKIPEGQSKEKAPEMLQALLAERFKITLHKETKTLPVFELTVAKGGPKLQEVDQATLDAINGARASAGLGGPSAPPPPPPPPPSGGGSGGAQTKPTGMAGPSGRGAMPPGGVIVMMSPNGRTVRGQMTLSQLVNFLTNSLDRPILDLTNLTGTYEIDLTYMPDETDRMQMKMGPGGAMATMVGGDARPPGDNPHAEANTPTATLLQALQQTLGLKLDPKRSAVEILVIDKADKVPTEN